MWHFLQLQSKQNDQETQRTLKHSKESTITNLQYEYP